MLSKEDLSEWPIYLLADYEGGGRLPELCRSAIATTSADCFQNAPPTELTTSDYQTEESSKNGIDSRHHHQRKQKQQQRHRKSITATGKAGSQLLWWQLIESESGERQQQQPLERQPPADSYRVQVLQLCAQLHRAISPFLAPNGDPTGGPPSGSWRLKGSRSLQLQPGEQVTEVARFHRLASLAPQKSGASGNEEIMSQATIRRLSWRRVIAKERQAERRRLASNGRTLWQDKANSNRATSSLLDRWIDTCEVNERHRLRSLRNRRWCKLVSKRGRYGESLVHVLLVNQTNEHLVLFVLLIHMCPLLVADVFESDKFAGLGCLHLSIAYTNERLLGYLMACPEAKLIREQRVTGSLFRSPVSNSALPAQAKQPAEPSWFQRVRLLGSTRRVSGVNTPSGSENATYWCDRMKHWPTTDGHTHLLLFDRFVLAGEQRTHTGPVYLGDTPLAWAVSFGARTISELLVGAGADPSCEDLDGNTCLHLLVINNQIGWTRFLVKMGASVEARNRMNLTPLLFACHLGSFALFNELLELSAVEFWSYSMISCCGYPLTDLDSIQSGQQELKFRSAMAVILESDVSDNEQKSQLLSSAVVKKLLEEKWRIFARRLFYRELLLLLSHLALLTLAISLRPTPRTDGNSSHLLPSVWPASLGQLLEDRLSLLRYLGELSTVLLSTSQLIRFANEWRRYANLGLQWTYNPLLPNFVLANQLIVLCAPVRLAAFLLSYQDGYLSGELARAEDILLIFAAPLLWSSLLFFIAAFRVTGPFVAMIRYMIVRDLRQFSLIYLVFLYSFAQCIFFINFQQPRAAPVGEVQLAADSQRGPSGADGRHFLLDLMVSYVELCMELFKMTLGVYDLQPYRHSSLARLFFLLFIYLIPILFNMLIAMMNNTYSLIISQSERAWSFQWARTLFALERRLSERERCAYLRLYSINMAAPSKAATAEVARDGNKEEPSTTGERAEGRCGSAKGKRFVPALVIIKQMSYTRAERRRLILGYWQKSIRFVLNEIKSGLRAPPVETGKDWQARK